MAQTLTSGLMGQSKERYRYCAGRRETDRRLRQIENGTAGFTVFKPRKKLKSWKELDSAVKRKKKS